ncbi:hypothetical protein SESBI_19419 [Sesbania bispinosa]|nr:hypothetical protein SESBI_19419 [Sesbania bispinosa]
MLEHSHGQFFLMVIPTELLQLIFNFGNPLPEEALGLHSCFDLSQMYSHTSQSPARPIHGLAMPLFENQKDCKL